MTIHIVIPVFNRLNLTKALVECLRKQIINHPLRILIVNDGSSDGTAEWLSTQEDIDVLNGNGSLFWGGAIDLAVRHLQTTVSRDDWVLLMNNDTTVDENFVQCLLDTAQSNAPAAVGSVIRNEIDHSQLLSIGAHIDAWRLLTYDLLDRNTSDNGTTDETLSGALKVDALSGRGVMFPMMALIAAGGMKPRVLPHYLADYEVSMRVRKAGWRLLVATTAIVYSEDEYGSTRRAFSWRDKLLSIRSPLYLPAFSAFWWQASTWPQRLTLPLRLPLFILFPSLRKPKT